MIQIVNFIDQIHSSVFVLLLSLLMVKQSILVLALKWQVFSLMIEEILNVVSCFGFEWVSYISLWKISFGDTFPYSYPAHFCIDKCMKARGKVY